MPIILWEVFLYRSGALPPHVEKLVRSVPLRAAYGFVFLSAFAFFFAFRSVWLDDWDSVLFARALDGIDLRAHHPHPPGYPGYVFLARLLYWVLGDKQLGLVVLSNLAAAGTLVLLIELGRLLKSPAAGVVAALVLFSAPAFIQAGQVAMADIVMAPFLVGSAVCFLHAWERRDPVRNWLFAAGAACLGYGVGVRPQAVLLLATIALVFFMRVRSWKTRTTIIAAGLAAMLAWLVPVSVASGGFTEYLALCRRQFSAHPNDRGKFALEPLADFGELLISGWLQPLLLFAALVLVGGALLSRRAVRDRLEASVSLLAVLLLMSVAGMLTTLLFHPLTFRRVLLPALIPAAFFAGAVIASGWHALPRIRGLRAAFAMVFLAAAYFGIEGSVSRASALHESTPPAIQAAHTIAQHAPVDASLLQPTTAYRHWQYYLPKHLTLSERRSALWSPLDATPGQRFVFADRAFQGSPPFQSWRFDRLPSIYYKLHSVHLHQYELAAMNVFLTEGTHRSESWGFWTSDRAAGFIRQSLDGDSRLFLTLQAGGEQPRTMTIWIDGEKAWAGQVPPNFVHIRVPLQLSRQWTPFAIESPEGCAPPTEDDPRCLGFGFKHLDVGVVKLALGQELLFTEGSRHIEYLQRGWSDPEAFGTWTDGERATIGLRLREREVEDLVLRFDAGFFVNGRHPETRFHVAANGRRLFSSTETNKAVNSFAVPIPLDAQRPDGKLDVVFEVDNPQSPAELGLSVDIRELGVLLRRLSVSTQTSASTANPDARPS